MEVANKSIEDVLFEQKKITADNRSLVKLESVNTGKTPEDIIKEHNFVSTDDLIAARGQMIGVGFVNPTSKPISSEVLSLIPEPAARRYVLIPFELTSDGVLSV